MTRSAWMTGAILAAVAASGWAVRPGTWEQTTEADFAAGTFDDTVFTSLGEVTLARATETLLAPTEELGMISAVAVDGRGRTFLAASPGATVYRLDEGKTVKVADLPGVLVRVLRFVDGRLLAGTSGKKAGLYAIDAEGKVETLWSDPEVTFVWAIAAAPKKGLYVATGAEGRVYRVPADGKGAEVVYDGDDDNVLSLAAAPDGKLYAGTGESGLIVEIDPSRKAARVLYDADESEISRLLVGADGTLYASTSEASKASGDAEAPSKAEKGTPAATQSAPGGPQPAPKAGPATRPREGAAPEPAPDAAEDAGEAPAPDAPATGPRPDRPDEKAVKPVKPADLIKALKEVDRQMSELAPAGKRPSPRQPTIVIRRGGPSRGPGAGKPGPARKKERAKGNAVYAIDAEGFVRTIFRRPVAILDMALLGRELVLATGHGGQVFGVDLDAERVRMLVKLDGKDVTALAGRPKGGLVLGTTDQAAVYALKEALAGKGTFLSEALDASQIASWGTLRVRVRVPPGCRATVATRSGNVAKPDEKTWSDFSPELPADGSWAAMASPAGRFLQYRLTLTGNGRATPSVDRVQLVYQVSNLAPVVRAVEVTPSVEPDGDRRARRAGSGGARRMTHRMVKIEASDPNGDELAYTVSFRAAGRKRWIELVERFEKNVYAWDTTTVPDGTYEVRVEADDSPSNPGPRSLSAARLSRAVVVDNTPPSVDGLRAKVGKDGTVELTGTAADATSRVVKIQVAVDSIRRWREALPADGICDSGKEAFSATIEDLKGGAHHLAVKATDEFGNAGHASIEITIEE